MKRLFSILTGVVFLSAALSALAAGGRAPSNTDPPIISWQAPLTYSLPSAGRTALTDSAQPMPFVPVVPCRQYDSRSTTKLADNTARTVTLTGAPCGIPTTAKAVAINITVLDIVGAGSNGVLKVGTSAPPPTSWINYPFTETQRANAGVLGLTGAGAIVVQVNQGAGSIDFIVDVFGWYGDTTTSGEFRVINAAAGGWGVLGEETGSSGIGVYGFTTGTSGRGVFGANISDGIGVSGFNSGTGIGVQGQSGTNYGVRGLTGSTAGTMAGVFGTDGAGGPATSDFSAGVRGEGRYGVFGLSNTLFGGGVVGTAVSPATYGVYAKGDIGATGAKPFIEPHPTDATKEIRFVALEGNEAGTYFRGTAQTVDHQAVIEVPEEFRMVTAEEGLTVQLTPVGTLAMMAVMSQDLRQIVVQSSRDVTFHYHVNGIRRAFRDWQVVSVNEHFRPASPDDKIPNWATEEAKSRMIANGTYNPDGTVNMQTAERVGWAQQWRDEAEAEAKAKAAEEAKAKGLVSVQGAQGVTARP